MPILVRGLAVEGLAADAGRLRAHFTNLREEIRRIRSAMTSFTRPGGSGLPAVFQWLLILCRKGA
jgi:hypothetical protein